jgi:hypothetical protein
VNIITGRMITMRMIIITKTTIIMRIIIITINTSKIITKGKILEMINIIRETKGLNVKTCMDTKTNIKTREGLNKIRKEIILSLPNIVSKSHTTIIIIIKIIRNIATKIGITIEQAIT